MFMNYAYILFYGRSKQAIVSICVDDVSKSDSESVSAAFGWLQNDACNFAYDVLDVWDLKNDALVCSMTF